MGRAPSIGSGRAYPDELETEVRTRDGASIFVRPIRPADAFDLVDFHEHLSDRSVLHRYFYLHPHLSVDEVHHLAIVDYVDRLALVAFDEGKLVGVGRYDRFHGTGEAEIAFVVADAYQRRGIGTVLLHRLAEAARAQGIHTFVAQTMADNKDMIDVFQHSGFPSRSSSEWDTVSISISIDAEVVADAELRDGDGDASTGGSTDA